MDTDEMIDRDALEQEVDELFGDFCISEATEASQPEQMDKGRITEPGEYPLRVKAVPGEPKVIHGMKGAVSMQLTLEIAGKSPDQDGKTVKMWLNIKPNACDDKDEFKVKMNRMVKMLVRRLVVMTGDSTLADFNPGRIRQAIGFSDASTHQLRQTFMARLEQKGEFLQVDDIWAIPAKK